MIVFKDYQSFDILGEEIILISDETCYGRNTVAQFENEFHYLGNEYPTISSAIFAYQELYGVELTDKELKQIMLDNKLLSEAV